MPVSAGRVAKQALILLLRSLAAAYGIACPSLSRDSPDRDITAFYRRVSLRAHPDKGGSADDQRRLNEARDKWANARGCSTGRPPPEGDSIVATRGPGYRIHGTAVLLTFQGLSGPELWEPFVDFVTEHLAQWKVKYWTATFEANSGASTNHAHLMLQFKTAVDRRTHGFAFRGVRPNASTTDLLDEGLCRKRLQQSIDRGAQQRVPKGKDRDPDNG